MSTFPSKMSEELEGRAPPPGLGVEGLPAELRGRVGDELIDQLLAGARTQEEIVGPGGLLAQLTKRLVERALDAELTDHLGYERGGAPPGGAGNARNRTTAKTLRTEHRPVRGGGGGGARRPGTGRAASSRSCCRNALHVSPGSTTRSSRCMRGGCRCGTSRRTCMSSTVSRSAVT